MAAGLLAVAVTGGAAATGAVPAFASARTSAITLSPGSWAQFRYSARHLGANPYETVLSPSDVAGLHQDWSFATGNAVISSPAVVGGVAYFGSYDGKVYAFNGATGGELWSFDTTGGIDSSPAVSNGVVYVGSGDDHMYAYGLPNWPSRKPALPPGETGGRAPGDARRCGMATVSGAHRGARLRSVDVRAGRQNRPQGQLLEDPRGVSGSKGAGG